MRACWCGNTDLHPFGGGYAECRECGTLVYLDDLPAGHGIVTNDEKDYYGKNYWLAHQREALGNADVHSRARHDLAERNLHWLSALLQYRLPPANVLELGCAHGSFVYLLRHAGFDAAGVELSPWVIELGRKTFGIPVFSGPVEELGLSPESVDVLILMDVLEHLQYPVETLTRCMPLLKPDGLLLIQTPKFKPEIDYASLVKSGDRFVEMLIPEEHLYLFSERSIVQFFHRLGADSIEFEPAIFSQYDMFLVVSRTPLQRHSKQEAETALLGMPSGRLPLALLDLYARELDLTHRLQVAEADRTARWTQVETLNSMLAESESDRLARATQIETLTKLLKESESDRIARGAQIEALTKMLRESESKRAASEGQIDALTASIDTLTASLARVDIEVQSYREQAESIRHLLDTSETARLEQAAQIEQLMSDLQALIARPSVRYLARISNWPEIDRLMKRNRKLNE